MHPSASEPTPTPPGASPPYGSYSASPEPTAPGESHSSHPSHTQVSQSSQNSHSCAHRQTPPNNPLLHQSNTPLCTVGGLAELLGATRTTIRDYLLRLNIRIHTQRVGPRHKRVACLTAEEAQAITAAYQTDLALGPELPNEIDTDTPIPPDRNIGVIYLLQLEPDHDPGRYKVGFSHKPWERLNDLLTVAPLAQCLAMWPARRNWERTAIEAISQTSTQIREEVFRAAHISEALAAGEKFFAAVPSISARRQAAQSGAAVPRSEPPTSAKHLAEEAAPFTGDAIPTRPPAVATACSKTCGKEAAPPGSPTSRCGQAAGGAEPNAANTPARESHAGASRNDGVSPSCDQHSRSDKPFTSGFG